MTRQRLSFFLFMFLSQIALAKDWVLFSNGHRTAEYNEAIQRIQAGDRVFLDGQMATIQGVLGNGNTTKILDIGNGLALRLPLSTGYFRGQIDYKSFIKEFYQGYEFLANTGIRIVHVIRNLSSPPKYLVVEKVQTKFSLNDYVSGRVFVSPAERLMADQQLLKFARSTAGLSQIGDFHIEQLRWSGLEWILMDYTSHSRIANYLEDKTVFTDMSGLPENYRSALMTEILRVRSAMPHRFHRAPGLMCHRVHLY